MTTAGFNAPIDERGSFYCRGLLGFLIGVTPLQESAAEGWRTTEGSSTSISFAYGIGAGFRFSDSYDLSVRIMSGNPEYEVESTVNNVTSKRTYQQDATTVQLVFGVRFE